MQPSGKASVEWLTEAGERRSAVARVEGMEGEEMTTRLPEALATGQTVWVYEGTAVRTTCVRSCEPQAEGFLVRLTLQRRREEREPAGGIGVLRWSGLKGPRTAEVLVRDIGSGGMQLELPVPVDVDQTVRLEGQNFECIGLIRYCRPKGARFVAGIQFTRPPYDKKSLEYQD